MYAGTNPMGAGHHPLQAPGWGLRHAGGFLALKSHFVWPQIYQGRPPA